ncbi:MAG: hypothetical protein IKN59_07900 [Paludibacteraceae bacterium]|nr:hypothetical protein [Paludibacteraceae bacterium]
MKHTTFFATSSLKKSLCVMIASMAYMFASAQQPFQGKIVYSINTTSRGLYQIATDIQGLSEEVIYISNDKFLLLNVSTQLINFFDLEADALYIACPPLHVTQKLSLSEMVTRVYEAVNDPNRKWQWPKLAQWNTTIELEEPVDGYSAIKLRTDTLFPVEGYSYKVMYDAYDICLKDFLTPELLKAYSSFYGIPYFEHVSDIKQECPAPLLKSVRYQTRVVKSMEQMTVDASVFTLPADMKVVSQREFQKVYNKYIREENKKRKNAGTAVEYNVPDDVWDF